MSAARTGVSALATSNEMMKAPARDDVLMMFLSFLPMLTAWHSHAGHVVDDDGLPRPSARAGGSSLTKLHRLFVRSEGGAMSVAGTLLP